MLTRRTVTTPDMPTLRTSTEMKPPTFRRRQAFHTPIATWFRSQVNSAQSLFHFTFFLSCPLFAKIILRHQQDLPDTTLFCGCLSLRRFTEWQFLANRNYELAISHSFSHEFECFPVEFREHVHDLH